jgi:hypothetical protein
LMLAAGYPKALIPFHVPNNITCLCVSSLSFHIEIFLYQHGRSTLDTSRTLFLLASTQGVSCRYMYMFSLTPTPPPLIYMWVSVCTFMCIYLFSCPGPSAPAPQLLIFHREYLVWCIVVVYQS